VTNLRGLLFCFFVVSAGYLVVLAYAIPYEIPIGHVGLSPFLLFAHPFPDFFGIYSYLPSGCCWDQIIYYNGLWIPPLSIWCVILAMLTRPRTRWSARYMLAISALIFELDIGFWVLVVVRGTPLSSMLPVAPLYVMVFESPVTFFGSREFVFLTMLIFMAACSYLVFRKIPRMLQTLAAAVIPLPLMVLVWDRADWTVHFTTPVVATLMPWFTNEVLFYGCVLVLSLTTVFDALRSRYLNRVPVTRGLTDRQEP
jgi:hypothetical protein